MGKAALILVASMGLMLAYGYTSSNETTFRTTKHQTDFEETALAREIARTGFNVAMGVLRDHGDDLVEGVKAVNGTQGYLEGEYQGGTFRAFARFTSGHSVEVVSAGYFGGGAARTNGASAYTVADPCANYDSEDLDDGACHVMDDVYEYTLPTTPLHVKNCSRLNVDFLQSEAGYCSAIFLERFDADGNRLGEPEMIFPADKDRGNHGMTFADTLDAGTQMNFFLGVDKNCSTQGQTLTYDAGNYDHVHSALEGQVGATSSMRETIWSMIEQHPSNNQKWRIAWEDLHYTEWDNPQSTDVEQSLQALKAFGYEGTGWQIKDGNGYRDLEDLWLRSGASNDGSSTSYRPDFSDQVVEVEMTATDCSVPLTASTSDDSSDDGTSDDGTSDDDLIAGLIDGSSTSGSDGGTSTDSTSSDVTGECTPCAHNNNKKVYIRHFTNSATNPYNDICIADSAVPRHMNNHDDFVICRAD